MLQLTMGVKNKTRLSDSPTQPLNAVVNTIYYTDKEKKVKMSRTADGCT